MAKQVVAAKRDQFLTGLKRHLGEMKAKILAEIDSDQKAEREANKDEGMDTYDLASEELDREINFIYPAGNWRKFGRSMKCSRKWMKVVMASARNVGSKSAKNAWKQCLLRGCAGIASRIKSGRHVLSAVTTTSVTAIARLALPMPTKCNLIGRSYP